MFQDVSRLRQQTVSACFCLTLINSSCSWLTFWPRSAFSTYPRIRVKFSQGFESNYITPRFVWTRTRVSCGQSDSAGTPECMISEKDVDLSSVFFFRASTIHHSLQFSSWRFFPTRSNYFSQRVLTAVDSCSSIASSSIARWPLLTRCHVWPWIQQPKTSDCGICSFKMVQSNSSQLLVTYKLLMFTYNIIWYFLFITPNSMLRQRLQNDFGIIGPRRLGDVGWTSLQSPSSPHFYMSAHFAAGKRQRCDK